MAVITFNTSPLLTDDDGTGTTGTILNTVEIARIFSGLGIAATEAARNFEEAGRAMGDAVNSMGDKFRAAEDAAVQPARAFKHRRAISFDDNF